MSTLIVPRHTGEMSYIMTALETYYNHGTWMSNEDYIETQSKALIDKKIDSVKSTDRTHYTKDAEMIRYFGFAEREVPGNKNSDVRISVSGKNLFEAYTKKDYEQCRELLMQALENVTFGRNNEGCGSDSDVEAPIVCVQASLVLDGITKSELAFLLDALHKKTKTLNEAYLDIRAYRTLGKALPSYDVTEDQKYVQFMRNLGFFEESTERPMVIRLPLDVKRTFFSRIQKLNIYNNEETLFIAEENEMSTENPEIPLQTIYFGSPGTGKSFKIKDEILKSVNEKFIFRTTFHPDTDYASFVGCYKPTSMDDTYAQRNYSIEELAAFYAKEVGPTEHLSTGHIEPRIMFGIKYCEYFGGKAGNYDINHMLELAGIGLLKDSTVDRTGKTYVKYGVTSGLNLKYASGKNTITYAFIPQTFTNAYVTAWKNPSDKVYLVIEEINRGNCAQIFGDLFQLLDRDDNGVSEYPIKADADLTSYLINQLGVEHEGIAEGKIKLPSNLYILATMNTSDQSLFPMDSAFKRRWEWNYIPTNITRTEKRVIRISSEKATVIYNGAMEQKVLRLGMYEYNWSDFLEKINKCITEATHSDDKQLGFWFVKTIKNSNQITIDSFVSKVIFYLWTDVFKDYGARASNPFAFKTPEGGLVVCPFSSFFDSHTGNINLGQIHGFMYNLGVIPELEPDAVKAAEESITNPPFEV